MMPATLARPLAETLPRLRGRMQANAPLGAASWFRVGGDAELLVRPADAEDLACLLAARDESVALTVLGAASNVILRDGGVAGIVLRLGRGFARIAAEADGMVCGAACLDGTVAAEALAAGLEGLEFLSGIPGSIGGAVAMNAGAYGADMAGCLDWVELVTRRGELQRLPAEQLGMGYRHCTLPQGAVVVAARLHARPGDRDAIAARMEQIRQSRAATQPIRARTGGSTFRNPPAARSAQAAWQLIDAAGCRGLAQGGAQVSPLHCNFLINTGSATAAELEGLGEEVRARVRQTSGVTLEWEIRRLGSHGTGRAA